MTKSIEERFEESFKYGGNSQYLDHLYEQYIQDPSKIEPKWKKYFELINSSKDSSRTKVIEMYPSLSSQLAKKKDVNKSDAILIASFFNNTFKLID